MSSDEEKRLRSREQRLRLLSEDIANLLANLRNPKLIARWERHLETVDDLRPND
jgi:hypothetical protein